MTRTSLTKYLFLKMISFCKKQKKTCVSPPASPQWPLASPPRQSRLSRSRTWWPSRVWCQRTPRRVCLRPRSWPEEWPEGLIWNISQKKGLKTSKLIKKKVGKFKDKRSASFTKNHQIWSVPAGRPPPRWASPSWMPSLVAGRPASRPRTASTAARPRQPGSGPLRSWGRGRRGI